MCTKDDLTELQRATFLLKKGYEIQKISVSTFAYSESKHERSLRKGDIILIGNKQPRSLLKGNWR